MSYKKQPEYATIKEYIDIEHHNKTKHPVQYFLRDTIPEWVGIKKFKILTFIEELKRMFIPKYNYSRCPTGLDPRKYYDIVELMVYVNFKFLERFVEDEECFDTIHWYDDEYFNCEREFVYSELTDLYFWWKNVRQKQYKELDDLYKKYNSMGDDISDKEYFDSSNEVLKREQYLDDQDTYNLTRLMKLRTWMWT